MARSRRALLLGGVALASLLVVTAPVRAQVDQVSGCQLDGGQIPHVVFVFRDSTGALVGHFDNRLDDAIRLPTRLQRPIADGGLTMEYQGDDRRDAYGQPDQEATLFFFHQLGPSAAPGKAALNHFDGDFYNVAVGGTGSVVWWNGLAQNVRYYGRVYDDPANTEPCSWYSIPLDILWDHNYLPLPARSWGALKARF